MTRKTKYIKCPKDERLEYLRSFCKNVASKTRTCFTGCEHFKKDKK